MKEQDIHMLVARFLDGETTLEEESRLYAFFQRKDVPGDLMEYQEMFRGYAAIAPKTKKRVLIPMWVRVASMAAACALAISWVGYTLYKYHASKPQEEVLIAKHIPPQVKKVVEVKKEEKEDVMEEKKKKVETWGNAHKNDSREPEMKEQEEGTEMMKVEEKVAVAEEKCVAPLLIYASHETTDDSTYQDPKRMDDFIVKFAAYHNVERMPLACSQSEDSTVVSAAYVFPDKKEVDVFGRLLQAACWYSDETPGYLLTFSHQQFFFELKDMRKQLQYRWIAERVNGKILLYGTRVPLGTKESSACYQEYRDELMHIKSINNKTKRI